MREDRCNTSKNNSNCWNKNIEQHDDNDANNDDDNDDVATPTMMTTMAMATKE